MCVSVLPSLSKFVYIIHGENYVLDAMMISHGGSCHELNLSEPSKQVVSKVIIV